MIKANTLVISSTKNEKRVQGQVLIDVPKQLKPVAKTVLTQELFEIFKSLDEIDPDIIIDAQKMLIEYVQNEVDDGSGEN